MEITNIFKALGLPDRLKVLVTILLQPNGESSVGNLAILLGLSQSVVSGHLKLLQAAELVESERRGMYVFYRVRLETLRETVTVIDNMISVARERRSMLGPKVDC